jgi:phosphoenolpyruvate carboxylase
VQRGDQRARCEVGFQQAVKTNAGAEDRQNLRIESQARREENNRNQRVQGQKQARHVQQKTQKIIEGNLLNRARLFNETLDFICKINSHRDQRADQERKSERSKVLADYVRIEDAKKRHCDLEHVEDFLSKAKISVLFVVFAVLNA